MNTDRTFGSNTRKNILAVSAVAIGLVFIGRLVQLQLIEGSQYRSRSDAQGIKRVTIEPIRGAIFDRYGQVIVANVPSYSVLVTPNKLSGTTKSLLARILKTDTATINEKIKQYKTNDFSPVRIWRDVNRVTWAELNELHEELEGVDILEESKRAYAGDVRVSHLLGYTKEISRDQLAKYGDYYSPGDVVGQSGIEGTYENFLRGEKGWDLVLVNNRGQRVKGFEDGKYDQQPGNGFDLYLGLDAGLQQYAEQLLKPYHGAAVAIDPNNGEILAMASAPDYDPNIFSGVTDRAEFNKVFTDPAHPLLNRATQASYPPGSTWKPLMSIAGLTEGLIKENTTVSCPGNYTYGGHTWKCDAVHGTLAVQRAIQASCDVFYYQLSVKMGIDMYSKWGKLFHFGERLGSDVFEGPTLLPSRAYYDRSFGKDKWPKGVMVNLGIGQGELLVNPLQLAAYAGAIANGGTWYLPHAVRAVKNKKLNETNVVTPDGEDLHIRKDIMDIVRAGMYDVVNTPGGTAYTAFTSARADTIKTAGKTGTAQAPGHQFGARDHAWFICFAPFDKPRIAICVLVENVGFGAAYSAPIARKLIHYFMTRQKEPGDEMYDNSPRTNGALPDIHPRDTAKPAATRPKATGLRAGR
jgi:penicillin-binding protein 2